MLLITAWMVIPNRRICGRSVAPGVNVDEAISVVSAMIQWQQFDEDATHKNSIPTYDTRKLDKCRKNRINRRSRHHRSAGIGKKAMSQSQQLQWRWRWRWSWWWWWRWWRLLWRCLLPRCQINLKEASPRQISGNNTAATSCCQVECCSWMQLPGLRTRIRIQMQFQFQF